MAINDKPWWGKRHILWGGETFTAKDDADDINIKTGDKFRIEKGAGNKPTLIPHPSNVGTWKQSHSMSNPIEMDSVSDERYERTYSMMVKIAQGSAAQEVFFIEQKNGVTSITDDVDHPESDDGCASVER